MLIGGSSILSTLRTTVVHDTRDEPFLPTRGHCLTASLDAVAHAARERLPVREARRPRRRSGSRCPWGHVLRLDAFVGRHLRQRAALRALLRRRPHRPSPRPRPRPQLRPAARAELPQHRHRRDPLRQLRREARRRVPHPDLPRNALDLRRRLLRELRRLRPGQRGGLRRPRARLPGLRHVCRSDLTFNAGPADRHPGRRLRHRRLEPRRPHPRARGQTRGRRGHDVDRRAAIRRARRVRARWPRAVAFLALLAALAPLGALAQSQPQPRRSPTRRRCRRGRPTTPGTPTCCARASRTGTSSPIRTS